MLLQSNRRALSIYIVRASYISLYFASYPVLFYWDIPCGKVLIFVAEYFFFRIRVCGLPRSEFKHFNDVLHHCVCGISIRSAVSHLLLTIDCNLLEPRRSLLSAFGTNKIARCHAIFLLQLGFHQHHFRQIKKKTAISLSLFQHSVVRKLHLFKVIKNYVHSLITRLLARLRKKRMTIKYFHRK